MARRTRIYREVNTHEIKSRQYQIINHGYLAVDFFFVLSGFVIGYAYDDRWGRMTTWAFFKRRLCVLALPDDVPRTAIAYASFKLYDEPVREWLKQKLFKKQA